MKRIFIFFYSVFFIFNSSISFCQQAPGIQWQNTIGGNAFDLIACIKQTSDLGYILAGSSESGISDDKTEDNIGNWDYWIIKTDSAGIIQWQNTIGGNNGDYLLDVQQARDGGYIIGGSSWSDISGDKTENSWNSSFDYWIIKIDSNGSVQWQNTIGGNDDDLLYSIKQAIDGGYILGGYSRSNASGDKTENSNGDNDYWIVKIDSVGVVQWDNSIGGSSDDRLYFVENTAEGGYILGGYSWSNISGDKTENCIGAADYWIVKTDSVGNMQWQNSIGGNDYDVLHSIEQTIDGGYILGGYSRSNASGDKTENSMGNYDYWIVKTDSVGSIVWQNTIGGANTDYLFCIQQTVEGGYILGGSSSSNISGDKNENCLGGEDYWIVKTDSLGNIQWENTIGGSHLDQDAFVKQTLDFGFIIGGSSQSNISGDKTENCNGYYDYWIIKLYPNTSTGISDMTFDNYDLKISPNPAKDEITIVGYALQNNQPGALKIYDAMGKEVFSQSSINRTSQIVDLKSFNSGVYFLQLQTGVKVSRVKFIKQ